MTKIAMWKLPVVKCITHPIMMMLRLYSSKIQFKVLSPKIVFRISVLLNHEFVSVKQTDCFHFWWFRQTTFQIYYVWVCSIEKQILQIELDMLDSKVVQIELVGEIFTNLQIKVTIICVLWIPTSAKTEKYGHRSCSWIYLMLLTCVEGVMNHMKNIFSPFKQCTADDFAGKRERGNEPY